MDTKLRSSPFNVNFPMILLMEEILHHLVDSLSHYLQCFIHPRWCRISSINSMLRPLCHVPSPTSAQVLGGRSSGYPWGQSATSSGKATEGSHGLEQSHYVSSGYGNTKRRDVQSLWSTVHLQYLMRYDDILYWSIMLEDDNYYDII